MLLCFCIEGTAAAQFSKPDDAHAHYRLQIRPTQHTVTKAAQLWYVAPGIVNLITAAQANSGLPLLVISYHDTVVLCVELILQAKLDSNISQTLGEV